MTVDAQLTTAHRSVGRWSGAPLALITREHDLPSLTDVVAGVGEGSFPASPPTRNGGPDRCPTSFRRMHQSTSSQLSPRGTRRRQGGHSDEERNARPELPVHLRVPRVHRDPHRLQHDRPLVAHGHLHRHLPRARRTVRHARSPDQAAIDPPTRSTPPQQSVAPTALIPTAARRRTDLNPGLAFGWTITSIRDAAR